MEANTREHKRGHYEYLSAMEVEKIKTKLLEERERILNKNIESRNEAYFHLKKEELSDPIDEACANTQASQEARVKTRESKYLQKVEKQLSRIYNSNFGECDECGEPIGLERLMARPTAEKCTACKEASENDENKRAYRSTSAGRTVQESLGRA